MRFFVWFTGGLWLVLTAVLLWFRARTCATEDSQWCFWENKRNGGGFFSTWENGWVLDTYWAWFSWTAVLLIFIFFGFILMSRKEGRK